VDWWGESFGGFHSLVVAAAVVVPVFVPFGGGLAADFADFFSAPAGFAGLDFVSFFFTFFLGSSSTDLVPVSNSFLNFFAEFGVEFIISGVFFQASDSSLDSDVRIVAAFDDSSGDLSGECSNFCVLEHVFGGIFAWSNIILESQVVGFDGVVGVLELVSNGVVNFPS